MKLKDIPIFGSLIGTLEEESVDYGYFLVFIGIIVVIFSFNYVGVTESKALTFIFYSAPLWLPYITFWLLYDKWMEWTRKMFAYNNGRSYLEIKLPPQVFKSPEAMEFVFTQIHAAPSHDNLGQAYLDGKSTLVYSFEIVSRGGAIHLYATIPTKFVPAFTSNMYAQYPGVEVIDTPIDYTAEVPNDLNGWGFMSFHMNKKKEDQLPIKTYVEYGLDRMPKEEEKVDPLTPMLEVMSTIKPGEQVWVQFLCLAHKDKGFKNGELKAVEDWSKDGQKLINKIMQRNDKGQANKEETEDTPRLTMGERDTVNAIERSISKYAYEVGIRWCYVVNESVTKFDAGIIPRMNRTFAATEIKSRNGIGVRWRTDYNYKIFADPFGKKIPAMKRDELVAYKKRRMYPIKPKIYSVEELATLFHLPGLVAMTPTLNRVTSTRAEAPSNLPIGNLPT